MTSDKQGKQNTRRWRMPQVACRNARRPNVEVIFAGGVVRCSSHWSSGPLDCAPVVNNNFALCRPWVHGRIGGAMLEAPSHLPNKLPRAWRRCEEAQLLADGQLNHRAPAHSPRQLRIAVDHEFREVGFRPLAHSMRRSNINPGHHAHIEDKIVSMGLKRLKRRLVASDGVGDRNPCFSTLMTTRQTHQARNNLRPARPGTIEENPLKRASAKSTAACLLNDA